VPWKVAFRRPEELLDSLSRFTTVDGVELLDCSSQIESADYGPASGPALTMLPSGRGFDADLPVVKKEEFRAGLKFMSDAKAMGFRITCNFSPLWIGSRGLKGASMIDATGRQLSGPADFPVYGCPNHPDVKTHGQQMVRQLVNTWPDVDVLALNHLDYPHMLLWSFPRVDVESLFACFCNSCESAALEQGLDINRMVNAAKLFLAFLGRGSLPKKNAPLSVNADDVVNFFVRWPRIAEWLSFRADCMTNYARSLLEAGREAAKDSNPDLQFAVEFELPSLGAALGTDFLSLGLDFDILVPEFSDYLPGSTLPLFAQEVGSRSGFDREALLRVIRDAFDLGPGPKKYAPQRPHPELRHLLLYENAFDHSVVARQAKYLSPLVGKVPIQPRIWENNRDREGLRQKIEALSNQGFDDFYLWSWAEGLEKKHLQALKGVL
jgi:hypothetical protein